MTVRVFVNGSAEPIVFEKANTVDLSGAGGAIRISFAPENGTMATARGAVNGSLWQYYVIDQDDEEVPEPLPEPTPDPVEEETPEQPVLAPDGE